MVNLAIGSTTTPQKIIGCSALTLLHLSCYPQIERPRKKS